MQFLTCFFYIYRSVLYELRNAVLLTVIGEWWLHLLITSIVNHVTTPDNLPLPTSKRAAQKSWRRNVGVSHKSVHLAVNLHYLLCWSKPVLPPNTSSARIYSTGLSGLGSLFSVYQCIYTYTCSVSSVMPERRSAIYISVVKFDSLGSSLSSSIWINPCNGEHW